MSGVFLITLRSIGEDDRTQGIRDEEMKSLISTLGLEIAGEISFTLKEISVSTYIGKGQAEECLIAIRASEADEVIINAFISPRQEKNLESILGVPISDREARLSQQRGGVRGAKGEGERKIELERRLIDQRIHTLDREIKAVENVRKTQRKEREKRRVFSFALTGYTNAGKSTILNALTDAGVLAENKLFATLDTTTRALKLPNGQNVLLSDTVGFISDLPEVLIKAFSSTLEEALSSDAIIIVADASHPDAYGCLRKTKETLDNLGVLDKAKILVINKIDDIYDEIAYASLIKEPFIIVEASIKNGIGKKELLEAMSEVTDEAFMDISVTEPVSSDIISRLAKDGDIRSIDYSDTEVTVKARIRKDMTSKYRR